VDLLLEVGAQKPEFLLTGKTLQDQGLTVAGMLLAGWTPDQLRQVIAGRPLPDQITTTVGAVVSGRLRQALASPAPGDVSVSSWMSEAPVTVPRQTVLPMRCCEECGRGFRAAEPGLCRDCREDATA
jgi:hypothetical protein